MNGIGKRLKQERKRLRLTQSALGAIGGVEANAQGHYESGQRMPRADYLFRIAAAGVNINRVVTGTDAPVFERTRLPSVSQAPAVSDYAPRSVAPASYSTVTKLVGQLRQSLWVTANALCEVSRLADPSEDNLMDEHLENLHAEIDVLVALTLARMPSELSSIGGEFRKN